MGIFDNIENATFNDGGNYFKAGSYDVEVVKLKVGVNRKKNNYFAADLKIIGCSPNCGMEVNEIGNWYTSDLHDSFLGNVKSFATALLSIHGPVDPKAITNEVIEGLVEKDGAAMVGARLRLDVRMEATKSGGTFSKHIWRPAGATHTDAKTEQVSNGAGSVIATA